MSKESAEFYIEIEKTVRALAEEYGKAGIKVMRLIVAEENLKNFVRAFNLTEAERPVALGLASISEMDGREVKPPGDDHGSLWLKDGKPYFYVYHPYEMPSIKDLDAFCMKYDLKWTLSSCPFYNTGETFCIVLCSRNTEMPPSLMFRSS